MSDAFYTTEDGRVLHLVYEDTAYNIEEVNKKMKAAMSLKLRTVVYPVRIDGGTGFNPKDRYRLYFYRIDDSEGS